MVARGGIEPPTRGFSVLANLDPRSPSVTLNSHLGEISHTVGHSGCSWVTLDWVPKWKPDSVWSRAESCLPTVPEPSPQSDIEPRVPKPSAETREAASTRR